MTSWSRDKKLIDGQGLPVSYVYIVCMLFISLIYTPSDTDYNVYVCMAVKPSTL